MNWYDRSTLLHTYLHGSWILQLLSISASWYCAVSLFSGIGIYMWCHFHRFQLKALVQFYLHSGIYIHIYMADGLLQLYSIADRWGCAATLFSGCVICILDAISTVSVAISLKLRFENLPAVAGSSFLR